MKQSSRGQSGQAEGEDRVRYGKEDGNEQSSRDNQTGGGRRSSTVW